MEDTAIIGLVGLGGSLLVALMFVIMRAAVNINRVKEAETSRRESAAYVAEGSMTPEDGERLLAAGHKKDGA